jgi:hypothetical protein
MPYRVAVVGHDRAWRALKALVGRFKGPGTPGKYRATGFNHLPTAMPFDHH